MNKVKLDEIDHQILDMLIDNTRTPFTDIAKKLLISAGTVHVRVKKLEEAGIISVIDQPVYTSNIVLVPKYKTFRDNSRASSIGKKQKN